MIKLNRNLLEINAYYFIAFRGDYLFLLRYVKSAIKNTPNESINEIASKLSVKLSMPRA